MAFTIDPDSYYSPQEAAPILGRKPSTLAKERCRGTGAKFVKNGKAVFYRGADMIEHLAARTVTHGAEYRERFGNG
jgi:hypothetical protein